MINIKFKVFILIFCAFALKLKAQQVTYINDFINWKIVVAGSEPETKSYLTFDKATYQNVASPLPIYSHAIKHGYNADIKVEFNSLQYEDLTNEELALIQGTTVDYDITLDVHYFTIEKKQAANISFIPFIRDAATGKIKKVSFFSIKVDLSPSLIATTAATYNWAKKSVLATGDWLRFEIIQNGVYKIDAKFLADAGLDANGVDISKIRLYGNGGGMLPQANAQTNSDDLIENPIEVKDNNQNGKFDSDDYLIFYGEGAHKWGYEAASSTYKHRTNRYTNQNYYYITIGDAGGKRITTQASENGVANTTTTSFDELYFYEKDEINFLKSGREWFGEEFNRTLSYDFKVSVPDRIQSEAVKIRSQALARSAQPSSFIVTNNGNTVLVHNIDAIEFRYESNFTNIPDTASDSFTAIGNDLNLKYTYNRQSSNYKGWLNFFELVMRRQLKFNGGQVIFRDSRNLGPTNLTEFTLDANGQTVEIWEITNPIEAKKQQTTNSGSTVTFKLNTTELREFVAFSENTLRIPDIKLVQKIENQNIHAIANIDMVIVAHNDFVEEAERLAKHHKDYDNLDVAIVTPQQIYNEFSSGKQDVSAIRNFMKMLYDQPTTGGKNIKYLLLFGDASYDYKDIKGNNTNLVPTYQSRNSINPVYSYCSDDFYGQLDDDEGFWGETGFEKETVDLGIGRFPVQTVEQARQMVDKVIAYTKPKTFGNWRNNICFIADDEDSNNHFDDAQIYSSIIEKNHKVYNVDKIYLDGYKQVSVGSGTRYPEVNEQINRKMENGALVINYSGHGGELGLAAEQIIDIPMINAWDNIENMPLIITATCEFSRFDDPGRTSAGELVLLNHKGGAIALFTTVRLVYAWPNLILNTEVYKDNIFTPLPSGKMPRLGDVYRKTKNGFLDLNSRNFTLLGDPAVRLAYPENTIVTTDINGVDVSNNASALDTIGALGKVTIKGFVADPSGSKLSSFNGTIYPTVFDKQTQLNTLANDPTSKVAPYRMYKNIIYNGKASVKNGEFEYSFIVPKDISYSKSNSKISYYATNNTTDAHGYYDSILILGTDANAPNDVTGPSVRLFMNDTTFRFGGVTNESPTLLALVSDLHGISTTGTGIGRDITAVLDGNRKDLIILNSYYEAKLDSYQDGVISYPLKNLNDGHHNIKVKVWDVYNNSAEGYTEFFVAKSDKLAIKELMNYPNPFSQKTTFYFEHNKQGQELYVDIDIYSTDGKLIKTLNSHIPAADANFDGLEWNVAADYGNNLAQGIYLFRIKVRSGNDTVEETEKMVLIK